MALVGVNPGEGIYPPEVALDFATTRGILQQYEGWRAMVRTIGGGLLCLPLAATPPGLLALSVWVTHSGLAAYAIGLLSLATTSLPGWAYRRRLWERPVLASLARHTVYDPRVAQVSVNVADEDLEAAWLAIRRAGLIVVYTRRRGDLDARPLNVNISVARNAAAAPVDDYAARDLVCEVFRQTAIYANVGGIEVNAPAGRAEQTTRQRA